MISGLIQRRCGFGRGLRGLHGVGKDWEALVVGSFEGGQLTPAAKWIDQQWGGYLSRVLASSGFKGKKEEVRVVYKENEGQVSNFHKVAVVGLGKENPEFNKDCVASIPSQREISRLAASVGVRALIGNHAKFIQVEEFTNTQGVSEGAHLALYNFDRFKKKSEDKTIPTIVPCFFDSSNGWSKGKIIADAEIFARTLAETPANHMTPSIFVSDAEKNLGSLPNVTINSFDRDWIVQRKMGAFLAVSQGSDEPPKLLEVAYRGGKPDQPFVALVGKGITFDSGGYSIKPAAGMGDMKGDMSGAASVVATVQAVAKLGLPINVVAITPLCENLIKGNAYKPGDIITASNGKTIEIDNTDAEGRLILSDALVYAQQEYKPSVLIDVATLTGAIDVALGQLCAGVFSNDRSLWEKLENAGDSSGQRFWRMPLFDEYFEQLKSNVADMKNSAGRSGGSCTAALFLKQFVETPKIKWAHIDIAGVMMSSKTAGYMSKGMTGNPTRALIQFLEDASKENK